LIYNSYDKLGFVRVLSFLKSHSSEYVSGQDLSDVLKISRVAIWKHIDHLKQLGYKIESRQKSGYRLVKTTELLLPWEITDDIKTKFVGKRAYYFDEIDSTQNFALKIASNKNENGTIVISQNQTAGKGRLGRKWISPKGGIWFSIILHPKFNLSNTTLFPITASLALANAVEKTVSKKPKLKWPNDIILKNKKIAGMLVDMSLESNSIENLILGVGINFRIDSRKLEKSLKKDPYFYGAGSLLEKNEEGNSRELVQEFLYELERHLQMLENGEIRPIIKEWTKKSFTIGKNVSVITSEGRVSGKAVKIDDDGALVIQSKGKTNRILVGDVI
jgi:BirA family biotin operon repressor/biotin-[acetyl-CoA-carboxylase] ligase